MHTTLLSACMMQRVMSAGCTADCHRRGLFCWCLYGTEVTAFTLLGMPCLSLMNVAAEPAAKERLSGVMQAQRRVCTVIQSALSGQETCRRQTSR